MTWMDVDPISQQTVFEAQWTRTPEDVYVQVRDMWHQYEYGNDYYYMSWDSEENGEEWPIIDAFLKSRGVTKCLIHWWW